jgi:hypothetical protein
LGVASLAQVHRARLKDSNQEVAVKVQHRYVKNHSFGDIYTMEFLVHTVKFFFPQFEFMWLAEVRNIKISYSQYSRFNHILQYTALDLIDFILIYFNILGNEKELTIGTKFCSRRKKCRKNI